MVQLIEGLKSKIIADGTAEQQVPHRDGLQTSGSHVKCITLVTRKAFGERLTLARFLDLVRRSTAQSFLSRKT